MRLMIFDFENCDVKIITVTPETAMELIGANYKNQRNVKDTNVSKLAQVMKRGEWNPYVGDLVRMTRDGILVDGQHRMLAVIESGVTCRFLFAGNFDLSDFPHIDTGVSRSAADSLGSTPNATKCAATLKAVAALKDGGLNSSRLFLGTYPHSRIVEEMNRVGADNLQRAVAAGSRLRTSIANSGSDAAFTLFSYLADQVSPEMFAAFAEKAKEPDSFGVLKSYFWGARASRKRLPAIEAFQALCKVWNDHLTGVTTRKQLKGRTGDIIMLGVNKPWNGKCIEKELMEEVA